MYAIVLVVHTWGSFCACQKILLHCENQAVVEILDRGSTRAPHTMGLVHLLHFCASRCDIKLSQSQQGYYYAISIGIALAYLWLLF